MKWPSHENWTSTESQPLICQLGKLLFVQRWDFSLPHPWHNRSQQWWQTSEISRTSEAVFWYDTCSAPVKETWQTAHAVKSRTGGSCQEQLSVFLVLRSAAFWDSVPDLSMPLAGVCGGIWGVGGFFPSEFACNCSFSEISHGVGGCAKWVRGSSVQSSCQLLLKLIIQLLEFLRW